VAALALTMGQLAPAQMEQSELYGVLVVHSHLHLPQINKKGKQNARKSLY
jgi:hypothetical protein